MSTYTDPVLFAFEKRRNLLLSGPHGVGKTTRPVSIFEKNKVNYLFFNCPTMDVYEDLRGIPVVVNGEVNYITPKHIGWQSAEFVLLDEPNRAHPKVIGALYELIQFKRINGIPLPNLKAVWATMNPSDDHYVVEQLDDSFFDRFQVRTEVTPELNEEFFFSRFPSLLNKEKFDKILTWWAAVPFAERKKNVSPRRVEYAISAIEDGGSASFVLPRTASPGILDGIFQQVVPTVVPTTGMFTTDEALEYINKVLRDPKGRYVDHVLLIPKEVLNGRFGRNTRLENSRFIEEFYKHVDYFDENPSLLIAIAKTFAVPREFRKTASNLLVDKFPHIAARVHVMRMP